MCLPGGVKGEIVDFLDIVVYNMGDENLILSTILQEKERIDRMLTKYQEELETLPKGTISEKKVRQSTYFYLKYHLKVHPQKECGGSSRASGKTQAYRNDDPIFAGGTCDCRESIGGTIMILFHGSNLVVSEPKLIQQNRFFRVLYPAF